MSGAVLFYKGISKLTIVLALGADGSMWKQIEKLREADFKEYHGIE